MSNETEIVFSNGCLGGFIGIQFFNIGLLFADYVLLKRNNLMTLSQFSHDNPLVGVFVVSIELLQPILMGFHLYYNK